MTPLTCLIQFEKGNFKTLLFLEKTIKSIPLIRKDDCLASDLYKALKLQPTEASAVRKLVQQGKNAIQFKPLLELQL